ncbi:MAG: hypothetical protein M1833_000476, partial [Piccolia ochrophora]
MPLHLLGKKSWNVYNTENIARVRRDEAAAQAREEAEEQRTQAVDAERRMKLLTGVHAERAQPTVDDGREQEEEAKVAHAPPGREKKRRRIAGEDDTDRDIRLAKETNALVPSGLEPGHLPSTRKPASNAPLTDHAGHINLFPEERSKSHVAKNPEAEAEAAKKKREYEDQYTMRFSNAAGFKQGLETPWYSSRSTTQLAGEDVVGKDVWGNEDPRRKEREKVRREDGDPLASMRKGVRQLKSSERDKRAWEEEREQELRELRRAQKQDRRAQRRQDDGLDG